MGTTSREKSPKLREIEQLYPDLTWHYGIPPHQLAKLPRWLKEVYVEALPRLIAHDQLRAIEASSFPHYEETAQRRIHDRWTKYLPERDEPGMKVKTESELAALGAMAGLGVVFEPKPEQVESKEDDDA